MAIALCPPYIEGKIPAQVGDTLRIPFQLNRAQGVGDLLRKKIYARIKTISTNQILTEPELSIDFENNSENNIFYANFI